MVTALMIDRPGDREPCDGRSLLKELYLLSSYCAIEKNAFGNDQQICKEKEMIKALFIPGKCGNRKLALLGSLVIGSKEQQLLIQVASPAT